MMSLLPVAQSPLTNHTSSISAFFSGTTQMVRSGGLLPSEDGMGMDRIVHWHNPTPLEKCQRPETR